MIVLICGGRHYDDEEAMRKEMAKLQKDDKVIQGGATGADYLAKKIARELGLKCDTWPALWNEHGHQAGPIRNQAMLDRGRPDEVWAFPGGFGTGDMIKRADKAGVPVREWHERGHQSPEYPRGTPAGLYLRYVSKEPEDPSRAWLLE